MSMFSERSMPRATSTWKSQALPTMQEALGLGLHQGRQARIVGRAAAGPPGHAEGDEAGPLESRRIVEEGVVDRIGAGPAALDIVDPKAVQGLGDRYLVGDRKIDALGLRSVAQGRIEEIDTPVVGHSLEGLPSPFAAWQPAWTGRSAAERRILPQLQALALVVQAASKTQTWAPGRRGRYSHHMSPAASIAWRAFPGARTDIKSAQSK